MTIDWITVSAQIINFLILVWLLKRFLYQPVLHAMERREQRINNRLSKAEEREQEAEKQRQQFYDREHDIDQKRREILTEAGRQGEQEKRRLLEEARNEVAETRHNWLHQINEEKEEFLKNLRYQTSETIQSIARKVLSDLADIELEERIVQTFLEKLKSLDKDTISVLTDKSEPVRITSAFELNPSLRNRLTRAIHDNIATDIDVEYSESPDLLCGIELTSGQRRLGWNMAEYMIELTEHIDEAFKPTESIKNPYKD